jgi:hypothetical protein
LSIHLLLVLLDPFRYGIGIITWKLPSFLNLFLFGNLLSVYFLILDKYPAPTMESLSETKWDVVISGTGLQNSLLALYVV